MSLSTLLVLVVGNNDRASKMLEKEVLKKFPHASFGFVHSPIGNNNNVTINGFYDCLENSTCEHVMVLAERVVSDESRIRQSFDVYQGNNNIDSKKPLLRWRIDEPNPVWCSRYDFACEIVVSSRVSLLEAQKAAWGAATESCSDSAEKVGG